MSEFAARQFDRRLARGQVPAARRRRAWRRPPSRRRASPRRRAPRLSGEFGPAREFARTRCSPSRETADASPAPARPRRASTASRSGTKNTACGLPILTRLAGPKSRASAISTALVSSTLRPNGISAAATAARPCRRDRSGLRAARRRSTRRRLHDEGRGAGFAREPVGDATRAVAAGAGEAAVVVVDQHETSVSRRSRRSSASSSDRSRGRGRDGSRAPLAASAGRRRRADRARESCCRHRSCARRAGRQGEKPSWAAL